MSIGVNGVNDGEGCGGGKRRALLPCFVFGKTKRLEKTTKKQKELEKTKRNDKAKNKQNIGDVLLLRGI